MLVLHVALVQEVLRAKGNDVSVKERFLLHLVSVNIVVKSTGSQYPVSVAEPKQVVEVPRQARLLPRQRGEGVVV